MAADPGATRRALLGLLAVLVLLGWGVVDVPRAVAAPSGVSDGAAPALPQDGMQSRAPAVVLRPGGPAAVPAPTPPGPALVPGPHPGAGPHLVADAPSSLPAVEPAGAAVLAAGSRAPPGPAGP